MKSGTSRSGAGQPRDFVRAEQRAAEGVTRIARIGRMYSAAGRAPRNAASLATLFKATPPA